MLVQNKQFLDNHRAKHPPPSTTFIAAPYTTDLLTFLFIAFRNREAFSSPHGANRAVDATVVKQCGPDSQKSVLQFFDRPCPKLAMNVKHLFAMPNLHCSFYLPPVRAPAVCDKNAAIASAWRKSSFIVISLLNKIP
jgi:hypothetical protein